MYLLRQTKEEVKLCLCVKSEEGVESANASDSTRESPKKNNE